MKKIFILSFLLLQVLLYSQTSPTGNSTEIGLTEGSLSVSLNGGANYSLPIVVPPGINGVVPQINLAYNSQGGNGMAGYGWNIGGISTISRIPSTTFHDGVIDPVDFDNLDRFALDGQRLVVKTSGKYGSDGTIYETENYSNIKITSIGISPLGLNYGPAYFVVQYPDGAVAQYGNTSNSRSTVSWSIDYWQNPQGVKILYNYNNSNNNINIVSINYGSILSVAPINEIQFKYITRLRPEQAYVGGQSILNNTILNEIKVIGNGIGFRNYSLTHEKTELNYERLKSITEKSGDGSKSYNPTVFTYDTTPNTITYNPVTGNLNQNLNIGSDGAATIPGDFDGDGNMDFLMYPTIGSNFKSKYWFFSNVQNQNTTSIGKVINNIGKFDELFAVSSLTSSNKLLPQQSWCIMKTGVNASVTNTSNNTTFETYYSSNDIGGVINLLTKKECFLPNINSRYPDYSCTIPPNNGSVIWTPLNIQIPRNYLNGDFNGDGLTDFVAVEKSFSYTLYYRCKPSEEQKYVGGTAHFINLDKRIVENFATETSIRLEVTPQSRFEVADVNGDGRSDILIFDSGIVRVYSLQNNNTFGLLFEKRDTGIILKKAILLGDYNGDGKTDFLIPKYETDGNQHFEWYKYSGTGIDFIKEEKYYTRVGYPESTQYVTNRYIPMDYDNDGKTDLVSLRCSTLVVNASDNKLNEGSIRLSIAYNKNNDFSFSQELNSNDFNTGKIYGMDSLGLPIFYSANQPNRKLQLAVIRYNKINYFQSQKDSSKDQLLRTITTGNGVKETITYKPLVEETNSSEGVYTHSTDNPEVYPNLDIQIAPSFQVVSKLEKQSTTVYKKQLFAYTGAVSNLEGLGFLGFRSTVRTNWFDNTTQIVASITKNDISKRGTPIESYNILTNSTLGLASLGTSITPSVFITKTLNTFESLLQPNKVFKIKNIATEEFNGIDNTNCKTTVGYDDYNNPIFYYKNLNEGTNNVQISRINIGYDNVSDSKTHYIGRVINRYSNIAIDRSGASTQEIYTYTNQLLTQIKNSKNGSSYVIEDNSFDAYGNIIQKTITATGLVPRVTNYEYDPSGRFLTKSTDIEKLTTFFNYNTSSGVLNFETNPYGLTTTYTYDSWFKKIKTTDYLNKNNFYDYSKMANGKTLLYKHSDNGIASKEIFDDLNRKIISGILQIDGNWSFTNYNYDIYDRNYRISEPYLNDPANISKWSITEYDEYGRIKKTTDLNDKITTIEYAGLTTKVFDGKKTVITTKNAIGNVITSTDDGGIINYLYDSNNNLKYTNYDGTIINMEYDSWNRKKKLVDPAAGTYTYTYNDLGEILEETTPKGKTNYKLDDVGNIIEKTIVGDLTNSITTYTYDPTSKLLSSKKFEDKINNEIINNSYDYDNYKRLKTDAENKAFSTFLTSTSYDDFGRPDIHAYTAMITTGSVKRSDKQVKNTYKNGTHYQILDAITNKVLWQTNTVNARGQLTNANLGNGINMINSYDKYGYGTQIKHDDATGVNIMTLNTEFEPTRGNLKNRKNSLFNWTEKTFNYDQLDRLIEFTNSKREQEIQKYDDKGRIIENNLGKYNYNDKNKQYQNTSVEITPEATGYYTNREGVFNDSMEEKKDWGAVNHPGIIFYSYDMTKAHSGATSLKLVNTTNSLQYAHSDKWIPINNPTDTQYTYSAWVYGENVSQVGLFMFMGKGNEGMNNDPNLLFDYTLTNTNSNGWTLITKTVVVPANTKKLNLRLDNYNIGSVWFDDVKIVKTSDITISRDLNVTYNTFKSPVEIEETGVDKLSFTYNDDNSRSAMFYGDMQADRLLRPLRKYYSADGSMEIKENKLTGSVEFITYIGGDAYSAPIVLKSDGISEEYLYLHRDYQGSILAITNNSAQIIEKRLFDAWGNIIKVQDGLGNTLNGLTIIDRGYTGHEHLQTVGIIHMNGRLYDPKLHRFLQPDNYIQDPINTQSYNRYGYCWNNPFSHTDISGEYIGWDDLAVVVVGGLINWGANGFKFNAEGLGYFAVGAAAGIATYYGGPYAGAAVLGAGNSITSQVATNGWNNIDYGQVMGSVIMSVGTAYVGGQISVGLSPYIDKAVSSTTNSTILQSVLKQSVSGAAGGFALSASYSALDGNSTSDIFNDGFKGAGQGFAMGAANGLVTGYVQQKTVYKAEQATKTQAEPTGKKDMAAVRDAGITGENAAGIDPNTPKTPITVNDRTRIPDALDVKNKVLTEVKNVKQQSFTKQLRDFHQYSIDNRYQMKLFLPINTPVTGPLQQQFNNGTIIRLNLTIK
jgi:RHS repeat-associated protein